MEEYLHTCGVCIDHVKISLNNDYAKRVDKSDFVKMKTFAHVAVKKMKR